MQTFALDMRPGKRAALIAVIGMTAVLVWVAVGGGQWFGAPDPGPTAVPTGEIDWGPLVVTAGGTGERARLEGTIRIVNGCLVLVAPNGEETVLVWSAERTRWDSATEAVSFLNRDNRVFTARVTQYVIVGGGESPHRNNPPWINFPIGCGNTRTFLVGFLGP